MTTLDYRAQIDQEIQELGVIAQQKVLEFARSLRQDQENDMASNDSLVSRFAGSISLDELQLMQSAIDEGCEQVDVHGW